MAAVTANLEQVLSYKNEEVVGRFCADYGFTQAQGEEIFLDCKRWLWLCAHHADEGRPGAELSMTIEMTVIDQMWHTFLLFTHDYAEFCERHFKCFIHHQPTSRATKLEMTPEKRLAQLQTNYEYIYDHLGADVLKRWCEGLSEKFG